MPSSIVRHPVGRSVSAFLDAPPSYRGPDPLISALSHQACGDGMTMVAVAGNTAAITYPASNRALGFMFCLADPYLVRKVWWMNGTTATTDSADVAVYSEDGATRIVSGGTTAIATANVIQEKDVTDTLLMPGRYWCVYNQNGVTATPQGWTPALPLARVMGWAQFAGAVPLGTTFTPAAIAATALPLFGIANRTQVA